MSTKWPLGAPRYLPREVFFAFFGFDVLFGAAFFLGFGAIPLLLGALAR